MMKSSAIATVSALALCACATSRVAPVPAAAVQPVPPAQNASAPATQPAPGDKRICIVENARVAAGDQFLEAYRAALENKGYAVTVVQKNPQPSQCPLYTRYTANWRWDLIPYLVYARLEVYREGKQVGSATHNARSSRFINVESKVKELVDKLLP